MDFCPADRLKGSWKVRKGGATDWSQPMPVLDMLTCVNPQLESSSGTRTVSDDAATHCHLPPPDEPHRAKTWSGPTPTRLQTTRQHLLLPPTPTLRHHRHPLVRLAPAVAPRFCHGDATKINQNFVGPRDD